MQLKEIGWEGVDWIHVTQDMDKLVVDYCERGVERSGSIKRGGIPWLVELLPSQEGLCSMEFGFRNVNYIIKIVVNKLKLKTFIKYLISALLTSKQITAVSLFTC
jgi:hypothetical protein